MSIGEPCEGGFKGEMGAAIEPGEEGFERGTGAAIKDVGLAGSFAASEISVFTSAYPARKAFFGGESRSMTCPCKLERALRKVTDSFLTATALGTEGTAGSEEGAAASMSL